MSDRELLQAAAKAARLEYNGVWFDAETGLLVWEPPTSYESRHWNPLTDDGDALRLAVKCGICFGPNLDGDRAVAYGNDGNNRVEDHGSDPHAATRRAIVRAAAAMATAPAPAAECEPAAG